MSKESRKCNGCSKDLPINKFRKRKKVFGGGHYATCKECTNRTKNNREEKKIITPGRRDVIDISQPIELNFLLDLNGWATDEIKFLLLTVQRYTAAPYRMVPREIFKRYITGRTVPACNKILQEFKEVAASNIKFDDYIKSERKFRKDGKKILAKPGK